MTVTLDLNPDIEEGLLAQARVRGLSLNDFLQEIVARQARESVSIPAEPVRERVIDVLMAAPFAGSELKIQRSKDYPRAVNL